jgi:hypothetical protein
VERYAPSFFGFPGGIEFQARRYVSLTTSSVSSFEASIESATAEIYRPYFFCDSSIAFSERSKKSYMIFLSSIFITSAVGFHLYRRSKEEKGYSAWGIFYYYTIFFGD